ncbi:DDE superfamily endonuclease [Murinocardiopsis flavida]|uniref:DDE superfamily endonuclease n=1 Tax=Murinocardiopsis flavida TaxID=645275 RepID=A0A2P8C589_9ACTN|nr:NF041680 family putative transposase [Murinocardiopsis flavida]PSK80132.1 DDE superfamily endonuclease [Murinocardiopsis flavida]
MSLPSTSPDVEPLGVLSRFRTGFYDCLDTRADALFELTDALLCADGPVTSLPELTMTPEYQRGHGAMYDALNTGRLDPRRLRSALTSTPLPRAADGRIVLAVDVSNWLRPDAPTSPQRLFCHVYGRGRSADQFIPGWPYSVVAALETGRTSWCAVLDAHRLGPADDATAATAAQLREVLTRLMQAGQWKPGDADVLIVMDSGYDIPRLAYVLGDLPVELLGRLRSDRVMLRDAGQRRSTPRGGKPRKHGAALALAQPQTWHTPEVAMTTPTSRYGTAEALAWDRMHPRLSHRGPWLEHEGELPLIHGTLVRLQVEHLPGDRDPKAVWLWSSRTAMTGTEVEVRWQAYVRRFDLEHTFRFFKQTLGWTVPKVRDPATADRWTWLVIVAHTQLRLARPLAEDLRRPWERPSHPCRLAPARVRRGFRHVRAKTVRPGGVPKPSRPGPGRPPGSRNRRPAPRYEPGKTVKRAASLEQHRQQQP